MTPAVLVSGHMIDSNDRPVPRFPQHRAGWVADRIRNAFHEWRVGRGTTVFTGGARGSDIIAAEEATRRGATVVLCLALPVREFERRSVELTGTDWIDRFRRLLAVAEVRQLPGTVGRETVERAGGSPFAATNTWMIDLARRLDPRPRAIVVWDGKPGDGPGGTADLVDKLGYSIDDPNLRRIDPTPVAGDGKPALP
jgi:hypothetical protein